MSNNDKAVIRRYWPLVTIGLLLVLASVWYAVAEINYKSNITDMKKTLSNAAQSVLQPIGGQEHWGATVTHGSNLLEDLGCIDTNCPQVEAYWYVPLSSNQYESVKNKIEVYIKNNSAGHTGWKAAIYPAAIATEDISKLPNAGDDRSWQGIHVFLYE